MQLREYIESFSYGEETLNHRERIEKGRSKLFDFNYPIFDPNYKAVFETNFIRNFYMREIGFESEGLFKFQLETWLLINMPYYNKLFESELIKYDPLESYSLKTTYQKKNDTKQDDIRNRVQNDDKSISQNDATSNTISETETGTQNDSTNRTQNDTINKSQNDFRDVTQNDETTLSHDSNTVTDATNTNLESVDRDTNTDTNTSSETNTSRDGTGKTSEVDDNFNRTLESDNPDTRLALTAKDGEGVIEYASKITENNANNGKESTSESNESQNEKADVATSNATKEVAEISNDGSTHSDTSVKADDVGTLSSVVSDRLNSVSNDTLTSTVNDNLVGTTTNNKNQKSEGTLDSEISDKLKSQIDDTASSVINNMEDYIENRVGSIGVKTYSEMLMEYRESLLRIEKQIFKEMNELFMLVY